MGKHRRLNKNKKKYKNIEKFKAVKNKIKLHKKEIKLKIAKQFVLNLSSKTLSQPETLVLAKGLNFVPTTKTSTKQIMIDLKKKRKEI